MQHPAFARSLPYWSTRTVQTTAGSLPCLILVDGTFLLGWEVRGADIYDANSEELNANAAALRRALNALPADAFLQIDWRTGLYFDEQIEAYANRGAGKNALLAEQRRVRADMLRADGSLRRGRHIYYLGLRNALGKLAPPGGRVSFAQSLLSFFSATPPRLRDGITKDDVVLAASRLGEIAARVRSELEAVGLRFRTLDESALIAELFSSLNPLTSASSATPHIFDDAAALSPAARGDPNLAVFRPFSLREQLTHGDLVWDESHFVLDDPPLLHRVLTLQSLPPYTVPGRFSLDAQFATSTPFRLVVTLEATDREKLTQQLIRRRNITQAQASGVTRDVQATNAMAQLERALERMVTHDQRVFRASVSAVVLGATLGELDEASRDLKDQFSSALSVGLTVESGRQRDAFLGTLPGNGLVAPRQITLLTDNAADFIPYHQPSLGDERPQALFHTREGGLRSLSFSGTKPNANTVVFGSSGSGKSFNVATIFEQAALAEDGPVFVVDVQGPTVSNYRVLCELFGGAYTALSGNNDIAFNPFFAYDDIYQRDPETRAFALDARGKRILDDKKIEYLSRLVAIMSVPDIATTREKALYEKVARDCILSAYMRVARGGKDRPPLLRDVLDELARYEPREPEFKPLARSMELQLGTWVTHPARSRLLDRQSSFSTSSKLVVFDFFGMDQDPELATVLLLSVSFYLWNEMQKVGREKTKLVLFDETWKLMSHPEAARLVVDLYKTGRKWGISTWAITQSLEDFVKSGVSEALINNASTVLLNQHAIGHENLAGLLDLNARQTQLFKTLRFKKGVYSEILCIEQDESGAARKTASVIQNRPTAFDYWINTTNPRDVGFRERAQRELALASKLEAVRYCAHHFPKGAPADDVRLPAAHGPQAA